MKSAESSCVVPAPQAIIRRAGALGILAGSGPLPAQVAAAARDRFESVFLVGFEDYAESASLAPFPHAFVRLGAAGRILELLRAHDCRTVCLVGPVKRPSLRDLRPDAEGVRLLARLGRAFFGGDDGLLAAIVRVLGEEGFAVIGAHEVLHASLAPVGALGRRRAAEAERASIARGIEVLRHLGVADIGQACVVQLGEVLAVEAAEGTDGMLSRVGPLIRPGGGAVMVKLAKPRQERRADLPTIGPRTVEGAARAGLAGIAFEAGGTLFTDLAATIAAADRLGLFLEGVAPAFDTAQANGEPSMTTRFLHTMLRVRELDRSVDFYTRLLGMRELRRREVPEGRYTLCFIGYGSNAEGEAEIELTYNWDQTGPYELGTAFGHLAVAVPDARAACDAVRQGGGKVTREAGPVKFGTTVIAFVEDPDGYKVELIERK